MRTTELSRSTLRTFAGFAMVAVTLASTACASMSGMENGAVIGAAAGHMNLRNQVASAPAVTFTDSSPLRVPEIAMTARSTADSLSTAGPRLARAGFSTPLALRTVPAIPQGSDAHVGAGSNVAMMGVGLAGIVVGSLVGGDGGTIIAVGGGVIGLIGLFRYLR